MPTRVSCLDTKFLTFHVPVQALFNAACAGNLKRLQQLLAAKVPGACVDAVDADGDTLLMCAAQDGHSEMVHFLLKHGAKILATNVQNEAALHVAAWNGHEQVVKLLLAAGAKVSQPGPEKETPLLLAADGGHTAVRLAHIAHAEATASLL